MKINETQRLGAINNYRRNNEQRPEQMNKKQKKDEIQISAEAKELLTQQTQGNDAAREAKLQELKQSVSAGTYRVDAGKLAERILPFLK
ncbi:flagellar biosynthesis anti-sigma factor FlgM [Paenibacillus gansuensis]|uniref:Negative regulator of flagellin synthesis n=1 Tax=Paenibacillus gansuensis TaxID=306542 RepID=A0ABW5PJY0_9BACL